MDTPLRKQTEIHELKHEKSSDFIDGAETDDAISTPIKDADTLLGMIVLLLACLALAALAHVVV